LTDRTVLKSLDSSASYTISTSSVAATPEGPKIFNNDGDGVNKGYLYQGNSVEKIAGAKSTS
jgi:hypothetical protein